MTWGVSEAGGIFTVTDGRRHFKTPSGRDADWLLTALRAHEGDKIEAHLIAWLEGLTEARAKGLSIPAATVWQHANQLLAALK